MPQPLTRPFVPHTMAWSWQGFKQEKAVPVLLQECMEQTLSSRHRGEIQWGVWTLTSMPKEHCAHLIQAPACQPWIWKPTPDSVEELLTNQCENGATMDPMKCGQLDHA